jgi:hypothetical protein
MASVLEEPDDNHNNDIRMVATTVVFFMVVIFVVVVMEYHRGLDMAIPNHHILRIGSHLCSIV